MTKQLCCLLWMLVFTMQLQAQKIAGDTLPFKKVLLIPYDPHYYLSDADRDIAEQTNQDPQSIRKMFRSETDRCVYRAIKQKQTCISLMEDSSASLYNDAVQLLSHTGFAYDIPTIKEKRNIKDRLHLNAESNVQVDSRVASQYINDDASKKYMKAVLNKPEMLNAMAGKYDFDVFVFVTQFEIKTNYASCLDIANKIYKREVLLHFTIYDRYGNLVAGNFSKSFFPSDNNNANKIIGECFPQLAEGLVDSFE